MFLLYVNDVSFICQQFPGYGRIILAIISFYFMPTNYIIAAWCYVISAGLDAFDGHAARHFNQCKFKFYVFCARIVMRG